MLANHEMERLICWVATLDRPALVSEFNRVQSRFPVDFTPEFLANQPVDRLRHIYFALCVQSGYAPLAAKAA